MADVQGTIAHKTHDERKTPEELRRKWGVEPGQLWLIPARGGWHRLLVDDATKEENLDRLLDGRRIATVATDPPYSSGGLFASARQSGSVDKYKQSGSKIDYPEFFGDTRDQRSWTRWMSNWLQIFLARAEESAYLFTFTDWRQMPATTDALQWAGWTWRGTNVWDKGGASRAPHCGYFRHQAEYAVWATKGRVPRKASGGHAGVKHAPSPRDKKHVAQKPLDVMQWLLEINTGLVVDPFVGSGTTILAADKLGRPCCAAEMSPAIAAVCLERLAEVGKRPRVKG